MDRPKLMIRPKPVVFKCRYHGGWGVLFPDKFAPKIVLDSYPDDYWEFSNWSEAINAALEYCEVRYRYEHVR